MRWIGYAALVLASSASAEIDHHALAARLEATQERNWPEIDFQIAFTGCQMQVARQFAGSDGVEDVHIAWLADYVTAPDGLGLNGQRMAEGDDEWVGYTIIFPLRDDMRTLFADDIGRYQAEIQKLDDLFDAHNQGGFLNWLWPRQNPDRIYPEVQAASDALAKAREDGAFGALLQRNIGWWVEDDGKGGKIRNPFGFTDYPPHFYMRDDEMGPILADLYQYRLENCPPPD